MRRHFLVPEVIQTSATDCGPAALKALFGGLGIYLSYGRLREACQTDVDGTSIDTLEEMANDLGVEATQRMLPADTLLLPAAESLPAVIVVRLPDGGTHFVVAWRVLGALVQVMDPAGGRLWMTRRKFLDLLHVHEQAIPSAAWDDWVESHTFKESLRQRARALRLEPPTWKDSAHVDAALRLAQALVDVGALRRGSEARRFLGLCAQSPEQIPPAYWTARRVPNDPGQMILRGAVILSVSRPRGEPPEPRSPALAAVRREPPPQLWRPVWEALSAAGWELPCSAGVATLIVAAATVFEAVLFRVLLELPHSLPLRGHRAALLLSLGACLGALVALERSRTLSLLHLGRHLELRLRARFLLKIPRLPDVYFRSRLVSDMAFRAHALEQLRELPELAGHALRLLATLSVTAFAIAWFYPGAAWAAAAMAAAAVLTPLVVSPVAVERDLRLRENTAGLSRFYLDSLLGTRPIQAHSAQETLLAAQAPQLTQWAESGLRQHSLFVHAEIAQLTLSLAPLIWLLHSEGVRGHTAGGLLLLVYWAVSIAAIGRQLAVVTWSLPALRNTLLRLAELVTAAETDGEAVRGSSRNTHGVDIQIESVTTVAAGHEVLKDINLHIQPGEHVAVVGLSGSGKSSLVGLLLGLSPPARGRVLTDHEPLNAARLETLRHETAWIDPQVHVFRASLVDNLLYGNGNQALPSLGAAVESAGLVTLLKRQARGLQTPLGEGGTMVSAGEAQRVRIGRALVRRGVRLAILDEPARGLERGHRREFVRVARRHFADATLVVVSHDVTDTLDFDRVLVMAGGRVVEEGCPRLLYEQRDSAYRALVLEDRAVRAEWWSHPRWRRLSMQDGTLREPVEEAECRRA